MTATSPMPAAYGIRTLVAVTALALGAMYETPWALAQAPAVAANDTALEFKGGYPAGPPSLPDEPGDIDEDLNTSFAQPGAIFPDFQLPGRVAYERFKEELFRKYGVRFGFNYSQIYQRASETVPGAPYNTANAGWAAIQASWAFLDRGGPYQSSLVMNLGWRNSIGNNAVPAQFGVPMVGAAWSNYEFTTWGNDIKIEDLFWEQSIGDALSFRVGNQIATGIYNFSRFKDARVSFTSSPFAFHEVIPLPTFGFGVSARWRPESPWYVVGTINDMNGDPQALGLDWSTLSNHQFFYGTEVGYRWRRPNGEFDHIHLDLFYADTRSTRNAATTPNEAGGGFRIYGEKQWGPYVAFGGYTYNTAKGGGISATVTRQVATAGLAQLNPLGISGEVALGLMWAQPFNNLFPGAGQRNQSGFETYWRLLVTPNLTITPGVQVIYNPSFNPGVNTVVIPDIKFRVVF